MFYIFLAVLIFVLINIILLLVDLILHPFFFFSYKSYYLFIVYVRENSNRLLMRLLGDVEKSKNFEIKRTNYI